MARAIAEELGYYFAETHGASFKNRSKELLDALIHHSAAARDRGQKLVFFIDEIHQLNVALQEALYVPMMEYRIPTSTGWHKLLPFTLIGATTRYDKLDANSFITRFSNCWEIRRYEMDDMAAIVAQELRRSGADFTAEVSYLIAKRCLGIPRTAVALARKVRSSAVARTGSKTPLITEQDVLETFSLEELDEFGLGRRHHLYLRILSKSSSGGKPQPIGVKTIARSMGISEEEVEGMIEPILLQMNMVMGTPRGKLLTDAGARYFQKVS